MSNAGKTQQQSIKLNRNDIDEHQHEKDNSAKAVDLTIMAFGRNLAIGRNLAFSCIMAFGRNELIELNLAFGPEAWRRTSP